MPTSTPICSMPRWHAYWKFTRRWELAAVLQWSTRHVRAVRWGRGSQASSSTRGTSMSSHRAAVWQAGVQGGLQRSADQHHDDMLWPHQDATAASLWRHPSHMAHCAVTAAQPTKGYLRRLGMRKPRRQVQFVLRQQGETHPGQHRVGATAVQPPGVRCTTAYRSRVIGFPAGNYRRGPEAASLHTS